MKECAFTRNEHNQTQPPQKTGNCLHQHTTTSVSQHSDPHISYMFFNIHLKDTRATKYPPCKEGSVLLLLREPLEGRGASTGTYQPLVWEPQQRLLLTPFCFTTSLACAPLGPHQFCLKLTLTKRFFNMQKVTKYNPKYQTGWKPP